VIDEIVDVGEPRPPLQVQLAMRHVTRVVLEVGTADTRTAVFFAVDMEVMSMYVAPGEDNLERGMEGGQGHVAREEEATPAQRADPVWSK
jgi:hypothetical protein